MISTEQARARGWLPPERGPAHVRAVLAVLLMVATFVLGALTIANLRVRGETDTSSIRYEAGLKMTGYGASFSSESSADDKADSLRVELAMERAEDIRGEMGSMFGFWLLIGVIFSGRPGTGPRVGLASSVFLALSVFGTNENIESQLDVTRWPLPVSVDLEFTWVYFALLAVTLSAALLNLLRWIVDGGRVRVS